ncbi:hypothetical protein Hanom_Chr10g00941121 [Helianthus anomalus]
MGRPSKGYTISHESLKVNKKSMNDDLFGLDSLLGLNNSEAYKFGDVSGEMDQCQFDLNSQPLSNEQVDNETPENISKEQFETKVQENDSSPKDKQRDDNRLQTEEINATIVLGEKLGAKLQKCDVMIHESII